MAIGLLCCRLAVVAFVIPFVFIYHEGLLLIGSPAAIAVSIVSATLAVIALVSASEGYLFVALTMPWRALMLLAGALLITTQIVPALLGGLLLLSGAAWLSAGQRGLIGAAKRF